MLALYRALLIGVTLLPLAFLVQAQSPVWKLEREPAAASSTFDCSQCQVYPAPGGNICIHAGLPGATLHEPSKDACSVNCKPYVTGVTQVPKGSTIKPHAIQICIGKGTVGHPILGATNP